MDLIIGIISFATSYIVPLIAVTARVKKTQGRISLSRYRKICVLMIAGFVSYWLFTIIMLFNSQFALFEVLYGTGLFLSLFFNYYYSKFEIQRLRDSDLSNLQCVLNFVPIVCFYYLYVRFAKKRKSLLNEFDEPLNYSLFFSKNRMQLKNCFIETEGMNFFVNGIKFEYKKNNNHIKYEVSMPSLEEDKLLDNYCRKNLKQTDNSPSYMTRYRISFLDEGNLLEKIKQDLHGIVVNNGYISINGTELFIRKNCGLYEVVYDKKDSFKIKLYSDIEEIDDYCCQNLNKKQLIDLLNENI